ncbi:MAG: MFS transporter [Xanthomonadales bacterium]|nr:MFS transporter [Gammaproteobacteria bacterium]MBT8055106.1 MFS transporter [Gammaproteobacteria bacterium]NND58405.1 MFS transporter [Xanthomonadales bacterium]NNK51700.1 MFS transporter [Xanthomonadales bacterium]
MPAETTTEKGANFFERLVQVEHGEWPRLGIAFFYFFFLLGGYFMLRPLRGAVAANNSEILHWLYTGTFIAMLAIVPVFGFLVSRFRRGQFIPAIYLFFISHLVLFALGFEGDATPMWMQRAFYIWLSVFNLFVVSVFWSFMADIFRPGQAQRLFGFIMAGGSIGAIIAPSITKGIVPGFGAAGVMFTASFLLMLATLLAIFLGRYSRKQSQNQPTEVIGGSVWEGAVQVFRSEYLLYACLLMLLHNLTSTFLFNGLAVLVSENIAGFEERTTFFSHVDQIVQVLAFSFQFFITSRLVRFLGMPRTLVMIPGLLAAGFVILGSSMGLVLFAAVQVAQRSLNYGVLGPTKEMLFTVVDRETKYKSKNFIDTAVYRGSDVTASWIFKGLTSAGISIAHIAWIYVPIMGVWGFGAWRLGRLYTQMRASLPSDETVAR